VFFHKPGCFFVFDTEKTHNCGILFTGMVLIHWKSTPTNDKSNNKGVDHCSHSFVFAVSISVIAVIVTFDFLVGSMFPNK
jgi:hypothetical protein